MKGLDKITERILSEARADADAVIAEAKGQAEEIMKDYGAQASQAFEANLAQGKLDAESNADRKSRTARLQAKKDILSTKQELIDKAYAVAQEQLLAMSGDEYVRFLADKACRASISGTEQIVLNEKDKAGIGEKVVAAANAKLAAAGKTAEMTLSGETADILGGLFLKRGDISVNCSIETLLSIGREDLDARVAGILFG